MDDAAALDKSKLSPCASDGSTAEARHSREAFLTQLWCDHLSLPRIGLRDDFFDAGGSSMQVIEMLTTVTNKYGKEIAFEEFFREPCIAKLSELLGA